MSCYAKRDLARFGSIILALVKSCAVSTSPFVSFTHCRAGASRGDTGHSSPSNSAVRTCTFANRTTQILSPASFGNGPRGVSLRYKASGTFGSIVAIGRSLGSHLVADDTSSRRRIDRAARYLNGQKLVHSRVVLRGMRTVFEFDLGGRLETKPYNRTSEQWMLYEPNGNVLTVRADKHYTYGSGKRPPDRSRWLPIGQSRQPTPVGRPDKAGLQFDKKR